MTAKYSVPPVQRPSTRAPGWRTALAGVGLLVGPLSGALAAQAPASEEPGAATGIALDEIVVTATRREESISRVPISITAINQETLNEKGIKDFSDVARYTPGVSFDSGQTNQISIRGVSSSGGSGTTGIYIDDVPIQVRNLGFNSDDALIKLFDLDRVEVLRGPQGTLFGAGSEGGTVRYITTQPSVTKSGINAKVETSYTQGGSLNYEAGVAGGMPVVDGVLGVRFSAWFRHDGGWVDRIDPTSLNVVDKNANYAGTAAMRLAALWKPNDSISVTPSIVYQNQHRNDVSNYWPEYSNPNKDRYVSANPTGRPEPDVFYLPALNIQADFGPVKLISTTSYFHRDEISGYDGTLYNLGYFQTLGTVDFPLLDGSGVHLPAGLTNYRAPASVTNQQENITQEFRVQSTDPDARLTWTAGVFYSLDRQFSLEEIHDPMIDAFFAQELGTTAADYFGGPLNPDGSSQLPYGDSYFNRLTTHDRQIAGFGELNFKITDTLKVTLGARVSKTSFSIESLSGGPQNSGPRPGSNASSETPFTPKAGIEWQVDPNNLYYFTYAKGFRAGGGNPTIPYDPTFQNPNIGCTGDFQTFGIKGAPATYKSDSVNSFEVGAKNNFNNRVRLASSIYYIRWNNIQGNVVPPVCQIQWTDNLGNAVSKGFDVQADFQLTEGLSLETSFGYTDARYTKDGYPSGAVTTGANAPLPLVAKGDAVAGPNGIGTGYSIPPYSATVGANYKFTAFTYDAFVRADYEYLAGDKWEHASQDQRTSSYDPTGIPTPHQSFLSLRAGATAGDWGVNLFVDNLTDSHMLQNYNHQTNSYDNNGALLASPAYRYYTFRPRTFGISFSYKH